VGRDRCRSGTYRLGSRHARGHRRILPRADRRNRARRCAPLVRAALAFLHVVTYLYWVDQRVVGFLHAEAEPICWPLAPDCHALRMLSAAGVTLLLRAYFAAAVGVGVLFALKPLVPVGLRELDRRERPQAGDHAARLSPAH